MDINLSKIRPLRLNFEFKGKKGPGDLSKTNSLNYDSKRISSPVVDRTGYTHFNSIGSPVARKVVSPTIRLSSSQSDTSLIDEIVYQCKRINSDFSHFIDSKNISSAVSQTVKKAVDLIIDSQKKISVPDVEKYTKKIAELTQQLDDSNQKLLAFTDYRKKLAAKEERFTIDEIKLNTDKKNLENEKKQVFLMKKTYMQAEAELQQLKEQIKAKDLKIEELVAENKEKETELQGFGMRNSSFSDSLPLKDVIKTQTSCQSAKGSRQSEELDLREQRLKEELLEFENQKMCLKEQIDLTFEIKSRLEQDYKSFDMSQKQLSALKIDLEIEQSKLRDLRRCLEAEKDTIFNRKKLLDQNASQLLRDKEDFEKQKNEFYDKMKSFEEGKDKEYNQKVCETCANYDFPNDLVSFDMSSLTYFPQLKQLLTDLNTEFTEKKSFIDIWFKNLYNREKSFNAKLDDFRIISSLLESKILQSNPELSLELEAVIMVILEIVEELSSKKNSFDSDLKAMYLKSSEQFPSIYTSDSYNIFIDFLQKFEDKAHDLENLEEQFQEYKVNLEGKMEESSRIAEFLKEERIRFESIKLKKEHEFKETKEKLMELQDKLDLTLQRMEMKEKELIALQSSSRGKEGFYEA
ncbi:hypothetical protein SteCoe_19497 [Stentor coeruleus]|uniref:Uncharacterized protein n=1 Tax=Stentor coeruleus TaxID=5963 RepID=A0A1R2BU05_9CILI|nr:hypothetical protein SteCoe_19497 [Stentor coeruleus]